MAQLHKRFTDEQVKDLMKRYLNKELKREHVKQMLQIGERRFFKLLKRYHENPETFSIQYKQDKATRSISSETEQNIIKELKDAKKFILQNPG